MSCPWHACRNACGSSLQNGQYSQLTMKMETAGYLKIDLHWVWAPRVLMHLGLIDRPFVPHNLISAQESPIPLPKFQMAPRFKILISSGSKKRTQIYHPFHSKKVTASKFPPGSPAVSLWRDTCLQGIFMFLLKYLFLSFAQSHCHCSIYSFIHICLLESPKRSPPTYEEKHKVTIHRAPHRWKAYIQWGAAWFPKGIVMTLLSLPQCRAACGTIPSTLAWVDQRPVSQRVLQQPPLGYTLHICYSLPHDPG
jgi:hypothetical protein